MTDNAEETTNNPPAPQENPKPEDLKTPTMAATDDQQSQTDNATTKITYKMKALSFSICPPTQRTRDAVANCLVETLSTPSPVLSKRYGTLPQDEAADAARHIETEAFAAASAGGVGFAKDSDGIELLQVYSKEISRRMLDAVKSKSDGGAVHPVPEGNGAEAVEEDRTVGFAEDDLLQRARLIEKWIWMEKKVSEKVVLRRNWWAFAGAGGISPELSKLTEKLTVGGYLHIL